MNKISINDFVIDAESPPFIIAEAGLNHNGKIENALEMIKLAKNSGADAIKFQTFKATEIVSDKSLNFTYKSQGKMITESQLELFKRCELDRDNFFEIKKACDKENILFLSTPQNRSDLDLLLEMEIPAIKIGSDDLTNIPLLKNYSITGLPLLISCGMSNLTEIKQALNAIGSLDGYPTVLMHTTSEYPTSPTDVNLLKFKTLSSNFPDIILGYSDHTQGVLASSLAIAFGAKVFEKHFTLSHDLEGPDHWFSEDPIGLKNWIESIKNAYTILGSDEIKPTEKEEKMKIQARRSVVAIKDIQKEETFSKNNIGLRRPGNGLQPIMIEKIFGKKATRKIQKGNLLKMEDFE